MGNRKGETSNEKLSGQYANALNAVVKKSFFKQIYSPLRIVELEEHFKKYGLLFLSFKKS